MTEIKEQDDQPSLSFLDQQPLPSEPLPSSHLDYYSKYMPAYSPSNITLSQVHQHSHPPLPFSIHLLHHTPNYQAITLKVEYQQFLFNITLLHSFHPSPSHSLSKTERKGQEETQVYFASIQQKAVAIKCYSPKNPCSLQETIHKTIKQYCLGLVASALQSGPKMRLVPGFDIIVYQNNCVEFIMEYCPSLQPQPELTDQLKGSLARLHSQHLVHQDIKPDNMGFSKCFGRCILLDYGFSRIVNESPGQMTQTSFVGTTAFCSKEMSYIATKGTRFVDLYYNDLVGLEKSIRKIQSTNKIKNQIQITKQNVSKDYLLQQLKHIIYLENISSLKRFLQQHGQSLLQQHAVALHNYLKLFPSSPFFQQYSLLATPSRYETYLEAAPFRTLLSHPLLNLDPDPSPPLFVETTSLLHSINPSLANTFRRSLQKNEDLVGFLDALQRAEKDKEMLYLFCGELLRVRNLTLSLQWKGRVCRAIWGGEGSDSNLVKKALKQLFTHSMTLPCTEQKQKLHILLVFSMMWLRESQKYMRQSWEWMHEHISKEYSLPLFVSYYTALTWNSYISASKLYSTLRMDILKQLPKDLPIQNSVSKLLFLFINRSNINLSQKENFQRSLLKALEREIAMSVRSEEECLRAMWEIVAVSGLLRRFSKCRLKRQEEKEQLQRICLSKWGRGGNGEEWSVCLQMYHSIFPQDFSSIFECYQVHFKDYSVSNSIGHYHHLYQAKQKLQIDSFCEEMQALLQKGNSQSESTFKTHFFQTLLFQIWLKSTHSTSQDQKTIVKQLMLPYCLPYLQMDSNLFQEEQQVVLKEGHYAYKQVYYRMAFWELVYRHYKEQVDLPAQLLATLQQHLQKMKCQICRKWIELKIDQLRVTIGMSKGGERKGLKVSEQFFKEAVEQALLQKQYQMAGHFLIDSCWSTGFTVSKLSQLWEISQQSNCLNYYITNRYLFIITFLHFLTDRPHFLIDFATRVTLALPNATLKYQKDFMNQLAILSPLQIFWNQPQEKQRGRDLVLRLSERIEGSPLLIGLVLVLLEGVMWGSKWEGVFQRVAVAMNRVSWKMKRCLLGRYYKLYACYYDNTLGRKQGLRLNRMEMRHSVVLQDEEQNGFEGRGPDHSARYFSKMEVGSILYGLKLPASLKGGMLLQKRRQYRQSALGQSRVDQTLTDPPNSITNLIDHSFRREVLVQQTTQSDSSWF